MKKHIIVISLFSLIVLGILSIFLYSISQKTKEKVIFVYGFNETKRPVKSVPKYLNRSVILKNCTSDADCAWMITNCCSEKAGAYWQCLNRKSYIDCQGKKVLCPQVVSPMPSQPCKCVNGVCSAV